MILENDLSGFAATYAVAPETRPTTVTSQRRYNGMRFLIFLLLLTFLFAACQPPDYPILFGYDGIWRKSITIEEDSIKLNIKGRITPSGWADDFDIMIDIEGLDTSQIIYYDATNFFGRTVSRTHYFDDKLVFVSEKFSLPPHSGVYLQRDYNLFVNKDKVTVAIWALFDNHKVYHDMTKDEFISYLEGLSASIRIENIFSEPKLIEVKVDKQLLMKKLRKWVPAIKKKH